MHSTHMLTLYVSLPIAFVLTGCGGSKRSSIETASVSGVVTRGGSPLDGVEVNFITDDFASIGKTDSAGRFSLVQGAAIGVNKVYFVQRTGQAGFTDVAGGLDAGQLDAMNAAAPQKGKKSKPGIPVEYSTPESTIVTFTVPEDGVEEARFDIPK